MKRRETVTIDRKALLAALDATRAALLRADTPAALRSLDALYRLVPSERAAARPAR